MAVPDTLLTRAHPIGEPEFTAAVAARANVDSTLRRMWRAMGFVRPR
jgi:hypothetical protein